jgi:hypothetical protein
MQRGPRVMLLHYLLLPDHLLSHYRTHNTPPSAPHITASQRADFEHIQCICISTYPDARIICIILRVRLYGLCVSGWAHHISVNSGNTPFNFALINFTSPLNHKMLYQLCSLLKSSAFALSRLENDFIRVLDRISIFCSYRKCSQ